LLIKIIININLGLISGGLVLQATMQRVKTGVTWFGYGTQWYRRPHGWNDLRSLIRQSDKPLHHRKADTICHFQHVACSTCSMSSSEVVVVPTGKTLPKAACVLSVRLDQILSMFIFVSLIDKGF